MCCTVAGLPVMTCRLPMGRTRVKVAAGEIWRISDNHWMRRLALALWPSRNQSVGAIGGRAGILWRWLSVAGGAADLWWDSAESWLTAAGTVGNGCAAG
ncbi:elongation factor Ts, partial [Sesbania bispinosa]